MPPKRFEGKFGIPSSHTIDSQLTSALYRLPESMDSKEIGEQVEKISALVNKQIETNHLEDSEKRGELLSQTEKQTLYLKLARHYEDNGESAHIDISTMVDALVESRRFLQSDRGSIGKLFELHEMKTLQRIAELRRERAEMTGTESLNPYENLLETNDGKYYLARLLNMPHLETESKYLGHCVGTSTSYINKMKKGDVEIFSFRDTQTHEPLITIEYDTKSHRLLQVKGVDDYIPKLFDSYSSDLIETIERLPETVNDEGEPRLVSSTEARDMKQLAGIRDKTADKTSLDRTELRFLYEVDAPIQRFDTEPDPLIKTLLDARDTTTDLPIIFDCTPEQIAHSISEITPDTKAYVGPLEKGIFDALSPALEHVYTKFPEGRVKFHSIELGTGIESGPAFEQAIRDKDMEVGGYTKHLLESPDFKVVGEHTNADLVEMSVAALGFDRSTRYDAICARALELGLELCPAEVGPQLRLQYTDQPMNSYLRIAMKAISDRGGDPRVFRVDRVDDDLWLYTDYGKPFYVWGTDFRFVFLRPRKAL